MNSVCKVKSICKDRKIPIYKLEKDLGYANGYIGQLKKGTFPDDRLIAIAKYLNVPVSELTGEDQKNNPLPDGNGLSEEDIRHLAAFHAADENTKAAIRLLLAQFEKEEL